MVLGTDPEVALVKARQRRDDVRVLLVDGIDPAEARREEREEREAKLIAASHAFESVALKSPNREHCNGRRRRFWV